MEIIGHNYFCNLSEVHLNKIDPLDFESQEKAFKAGGLFVAAMLHHKFEVEIYRKSREQDPIVGVSFTGLFDFFVKAFGVDWLEWFQAGRPDTYQGQRFKSQEAAYLTRWREIAEKTIWEYCDKHGLKRPNRCTTVQPSGTKSLLTNASPGWHPPKYTHYIRRITFRVNDPVALALIDSGFNVVPSQSDKDENGNLLNDPYDSRVKDWLVEIPVKSDWADLPGVGFVDTSKYSAVAQFDFYMQVQQHYTTHNVSGTIELRENEITELGTRIHQAIKNDEGYISSALLARFDAKETFPRLPFEPITKEEYEKQKKLVQSRVKSYDFMSSLNKYLKNHQAIEHSPSGCDSDACLLSE